MTRRTVLRRLAAGAYAALGAAALLRPAAVPAVFGGAAPTAASRTEVRAVYAGIPLALAVSLLAPPGPATRADAGVLRAVRNASAGMALARGAGCLLERQVRAWPTGAFLALEAALAGALQAALTAPDPPSRRRPTS